MNIFADDAMRLRRGPGDVAGHLRIVMRHPPGAKAERGGIGVAGLHLKLRPVDGAAVETRRRSGLQPATAQAKLLQSFAQKHGGGFAGASRGILLLAAMDQAVEERAGGDDDSGRADGASVAQADAADSLALIVVGRWSLVVGRAIVRPASDSPS